MGLRNLDTHKAPGDVNAACWPVDHTWSGPPNPFQTSRKEELQLGLGRNNPPQVLFSFKASLSIHGTVTSSTEVLNCGSPQPPEAAAGPGNWLEIKILRPIPDPLPQRLWGQGPEICALLSLLSDSAASQSLRTAALFSSP